ISVAEGRNETICCGAPMSLFSCILRKELLHVIGIRTGSGSDRVFFTSDEIEVGHLRSGSFLTNNPVATAPGSDTD
ncbi:MAG: hypothetical protein M3539_13140, partial [Acidobacteriota bacterium]|nr:hypothetical protein [Acidobacteriota bacterium]